MHKLRKRQLKGVSGISKKVNLAALVEGDQKFPFTKVTTPRYRGGHYPIPWITPLLPLLLTL